MESEAARRDGVEFGAWRVTNDEAILLAFI